MKINCKISTLLAAIFLITCCNCQRSQLQRRVKSIQNYWQQFMLHPTSTPPSTTPRSPPKSLNQIIEEKAKRRCGVRTSSYLPHMPLTDRAPRRRGRIVWDDTDTMGTAPAPSGTFPWMASLFVLFRSGEALFMCAATVLTPNLLLTAAHCFTNNLDEDTWFARVGDNYILSPDPNEQTFRVKKIIQHHRFDPLREDGGDGRHDIALVSLYPHRDRSLIQFSLDVLPICVPQPDYPLHKLYEQHCEIAGWGMTEYNNTSSYPDSVRAARITVGDIPKNYCDYLYQRDVKATGKFCAGGTVDACQEDSGGPLVCRLESGQYHIAGIVSSGKGCGVYPGLYTEVSRYVDWIKFWIEKESV